MQSYLYENRSSEPNLRQIHTDVAASAMDDKVIDYCRWDQATERISVFFINELSTNDETRLGVIVGNS